MLSGSKDVDLLLITIGFIQVDGHSYIEIGAQLTKSLFSGVELLLADAFLVLPSFVEHRGHLGSEQTLNFSLL